MAKVSISLMTYNHEKFIRQCIDGILMQDFEDYEIVVADDASTDNTIEVIKEMIKDKNVNIKILQNSKNLGIGKNFIRLMSNCGGDYIAMLDGDDFWIDPGKLRKQVDFLESNPDYVLTFARARVLKPKGYDRFKEYIFSKRPKDINFTIEDVMNDLFMPTGTVLVRNVLKGKIPTWFEDLKICDKPFHLLNLQFGGKIKYFHNVTTVYRVHENGSWSMQEGKVQQEFLNGKITMLNHFNKETNYKFNEMITKTIFRCKTNLIVNAIKNGEEPEIYVENFKEIKENIQSFLKGKNIYIFGTGEAGKKAWILANSLDFEIKGFFDNDRKKQGKLFYERKIYSPEDIKVLNNGIYIIVGSMFYSEISNQLQKEFGMLEKQNYIYYTELLNLLT